MQIKLVFKLIIFLLLIQQLPGQDLNQTNYRYAPLYLNPALSGHFPGSARILASYRDQGRELLFDEYRTMQFFADMPIAGSFKENDWSGLGIGVYSDQAGKVPVSTQGIFLNGAYHLSLDKKRRNILSAGIQYGVVQRSMEGDQIIFESDHIDPGVTLTDRSNFAAFNSQYHDLNAGINFAARNKNGNRFNIGISAFHLIQTNLRFLIDHNFYDRRFSAYSSYFFGLTKQFFLQPEIIASVSQNSRNISPQIKAFFKLSKDKKKTDMLYFGTGYRVGDALQLMFGINFKKWDVGVAYDVTVSSASEYNNGRGGFEIGVFRIFEIPQKPTVIPSLICPRL